MTPGARRTRLGTLLAGAIMCSLVTACDRSTTPTTPTAVTTPTTTPEPTLPNSPVSVSISGAVTASGGGPVASARVEITAGLHTGQATTTDAAGQYTLTNLGPGAITLRVSALAYLTQSMDLTLAATQTANVTLTMLPFQTHGRAFDIDTGSALSGVTMTGDAVSATTSSQSGTFIAFAASDSGGPRAVLLDGPGIVQRRTTVRVPGPDVSLSLIASTFDLTAFDQMVRAPMLFRWTTPPPLIMERRTLQFTTADALTATATDDVMTDAEVSSLESDLQTALSPMTGGAFNAFASIQNQMSSPADTVGILNTGSITVMRMAGLTAATGVWGFGRFQVLGDGTVIGGIVMLDRDFERSGSPYLRSLRAHELGHALGYSHVTSRVSVMNADATTEPTAWDTLACRIAFGRMPGNRSPDIDAAAGSSALAGAARWVNAIR